MTPSKRQSTIASLAFWKLCALWTILFALALEHLDLYSKARTESLTRKEYVQIINRLSEDPGYFDTDNIVSNELSYLQISGTLVRLGIRGGVYLGVGSEQNFTYIARTRPHMAILLDIRRDNLLYHLLFKALFDLSSNRAEFLANLFGKPLPAMSFYLRQCTIADLISALEKGKPSELLFERRLAQILGKIHRAYQFPLSSSDVKTVRHIYREFFDQQWDLRFRSHGRQNAAFYPSLREICMEQDLEGQRGNYLNREDDFQFVKNLHAKNMIIPVVGDFAGRKALRAIGVYLKELGDTISVFYVSNVEFYLLQNGVFGKYVENVSALPIDDRSLFIRSYFRFPHPERRSGYISATIVQRIQKFLQLYNEGEYHSYQDLGLLDYLRNE